MTPQHSGGMPTNHAAVMGYSIKAGAHSGRAIAGRPDNDAGRIAPGAAHVHLLYRVISRHCAYEVCPFEKLPPPPSDWPTADQRRALCQCSRGGTVFRNEELS